MKNTSYIKKFLFIVFICILGNVGFIQAQDISIAVPLRLNEINIQAARYFNKKCPEVTEQTWYNTSIGNQVVYRENGIARQTLFNQRGEYEYTINFIGAKELPQSIWNRLNESFPGFALQSVSEVQIAEKLLYFVTIIQKNAQKYLTISDEDIQLSANIILTAR
jgi:hypothetical protein